MDSGKKCESWIVLNGQEYNCQWTDGHIGCHSAWRNQEKLKWGKDDDASKPAPQEAEGVETIVNELLERAFGKVCYCHKDNEIMCPACAFKPFLEQRLQAERSKTAEVEKEILSTNALFVKHANEYHRQIDALTKRNQELEKGFKYASKSAEEWAAIAIEGQKLINDLESRLKANDLK